MQQEDLKSYKGVKNQEALLLRSPKYGLVVVWTNLPNLTVTLLFQILVTTHEYLNLNSFIPEYYKGPNIRERQIEYYQHNTISDKLLEVIIFKCQ